MNGGAQRTGWASCDGQGVVPFTGDLVHLSGRAGEHRRPFAEAIAACGDGGAGRPVHKTALERRPRERIIALDGGPLPVRLESRGIAMKLVPLVDHPRRRRPIRWGVIIGWVLLCVAAAAVAYLVVVRIGAGGRPTEETTDTPEVIPIPLEEKPTPVSRTAPADFGTRPVALAEADSPKARRLLSEGRTLADQNLTDKARASFEQVATTWPDTVEGVQALVELGLADKKAGKLEEARRHLTEALLKSPEATLEARIIATLDEINKDLVFSPLETSDSVIHVVEPGESLSAIGRKWKMPYRSIMRINGIRDPKRIQPGQRLKILQGEFHILVDKSEMNLTLFLNGQYIKRYRVGIGRHDLTPEGTFVIDKKQVDPDWYPPGGGVLKFGHPDNPLGTRWLGFRNTAEFSGYGIHGTDDPDSIGARVSQGCIRMLNAEVEELFDLVVTGTRVTITD